MLEEVEKMMTSAGVSLNYRIINLGGNVLYIEGLKSIISLAENEMFFALKSATLKVYGVNLKLKYLDKSSCSISGLIQKVETM